MLPAAARLRQRAEFTTTVRGGHRGRSGLLAVYLDDSPSGAPALPALRVGFVVSRAVGGAVVRNRVLRRLRHLAAARLDRVPAGTRLVVRALPPAAGANSPELAAALDAALGQAIRKSRTAPRSTGAQSPAADPRAALNEPVSSR